MADNRFNQIFPNTPQTSKIVDNNGWGKRFIAWSAPASDNEEGKIDSAKKKVSAAIQGSRFLAQHKWEIIPQGSYHNNTNVRFNSDLDLCICLSDIIRYDQTYGTPSLEQVGLTPLDFDYHSFKRHIFECLDKGYKGLVTEGEKAIHLNKDKDGEVSVDIVPAFTYRKYSPAHSAFALYTYSQEQDGIWFLTQSGIEKNNYPKQHYENGVKKRKNSFFRFKKVVRILKRLRDEMLSDTKLGKLAREAVLDTPSYLIECLVYNVPDNLFGNAEIFDDVASVIEYLEHNLSDERTAADILFNAREKWTEVNGIKPLFSPSQKWDRMTAQKFIMVASYYLKAR